MLLFIALIQFWSYHAIQHLHFRAENDDAGSLLRYHLFMGSGDLGLHAIHPFTTFLMISYSSNVASTPVINCIVFAKQTSCHPFPARLYPNTKVFYPSKWNSCWVLLEWILAPRVQALGMPNLAIFRTVSVKSSVATPACHILLQQSGGTRNYIRSPKLNNPSPTHAAHELPAI